MFTDLHSCHGTKYFINVDISIIIYKIPGYVSICHPLQSALRFLLNPSPNKHANGFFLSSHKNGEWLGAYWDFLVPYYQLFWAVRFIVIHRWPYRRTRRQRPISSPDHILDIPRTGLFLPGRTKLHPRVLFTMLQSQRSDFLNLHTLLLDIHIRNWFSLRLAFTPGFTRKVTIPYACRWCFHPVLKRVRLNSVFTISLTLII